MTMIGSDVLRARLALGWSRAELARRSGITQSRVATVERSRPGWSGWQDGEHDALDATLRGALSDPEMASTSGDGSSVLPETFDDEVVKQEEWCGLKSGDLVRLQDDPKQRAQYRFIHYFRNPAQEHVHLVAVRNGGSRDVRPERILKCVKGKWVRALEQVEADS